MIGKLLRNLGSTSESHGGISLPWFPVGLAGLMIAIDFIGAKWTGLLIFDRVEVYDGELWRLVTGHFVHLNTQHLLWNVVAFVVMSLMAKLDEGISFSRQLAIVVCGMIVIDAAILAGPASLARYAGFSGVLNALWAVMIVESWRKRRSAIVVCLGVLSLAKIAYEVLTAQTLFFVSPWPAAWEGHAGGVLAGLVFLVLERFMPEIVPSVSEMSYQKQSIR